MIKYIALKKRRLIVFLPHVRESRRSGTFLLVESGITDFGIRNTAQGIRNLTNDWNPESSTCDPESPTWNPESKTVLDSVT